MIMVQRDGKVATRVKILGGATAPLNYEYKSSHKAYMGHLTAPLHTITTHFRF